MPADWSAIEALPSPKLTDLFAQDEGRLAKFSLDVAGIHFDWSKTQSDHRGGDRVRGAGQADGPGGQARGDVRGQERPTPPRIARSNTPPNAARANPDSVARAAQYHARMRTLIDAIEADALGPIRYVLHVGIGGSALGAAFAGRRAGPRSRSVRGRDRVQCRRHGAGGRVREVRSADDAAGHRVEDLHHHRDAAERQFGDPVDDRERRRGSLWQGDRADCIARQGGGMGCGRDAHPAVFGRRRRTLFAVVVDRLPRPPWRWDGIASRNCWTARPRWIAISA